MNRLTATEFPQEVLDLYDAYAHGRMDRRTYIQRLGAFAVGGLTVETLLTSLSPNYSWAQEIEPDDERIQTERVTYPSPEGGGKVSGLMAWPTTGKKHPAVLVIHENRGLNPYIEDVVRRLAVAGYLAFGPDALSPLGGYPGNDDEGRVMQRKRDREKMTQDFIAAAKLLDNHEKSSGKVGAVGFCFGGGMVYQLAVRIPDVIDAGVPFYGRPPEIADIEKIKAPLMIHNASLDRRIMRSAEPFVNAMKEQGKEFESFVYDNVNHGFHNDSTPRYDETAAKLAWKRTLGFFDSNLRVEKASPEDDKLDLTGDWLFQASPMGSTPIPNAVRAWKDAKRKVVILDGSICLRHGPLELFACPRNSKEHESIVAVDAAPSAIHNALVELGVKPGKPVAFEPEYRPASGPKIRVYVAWIDDNKKRHAIPAQKMIRNAKTGKTMEASWVFGGSVFVKTELGTRYLADNGDFICVSNFGTACMDVSIKSEQANNALLFECNSEEIPKLKSNVRIVIAAE